MSENSVQEDTADVQERLMQMLDSVRLDGDPGSKPKPEPVASSHACDNCGTNDDWGKSTWCPRCGYYPKLGRVVVQEAEEETIEEVEEELTPLDLISRIPIWVSLVVGGCSSIFVMDLIIRLSCSEVSYRGDIALTQIVVGLIVFSFAHLRAYFMSAHKTDGIPFSAIFFAPGKIWQATARHLPNAKVVFCGGSWGMSAIFMAVLVIGLDWDSMFTPGKNVDRPRFNPAKMFMCYISSFGQKQETAGNPTGIDPGDLDGAISLSSEVGVDTLTNDDGSRGEVSQTQGQHPGGNDSPRGPIAPGGSIGRPKNVPRNGSLTIPNAPGQGTPNTTTTENNPSPTSGTQSQTNKTLKPPLTFQKSPQTESGVKCKLPNRIDYMAYGYTTNAAGDLRAILLAEMRNGKPYRFASRVHLDATDPDLREKIEERFAAIRVDRPAVRTPYRARWVKPIVMCHIGYDSKTFDGRLNDAKILSCYEVE